MLLIPCLTIDQEFDRLESDYAVLQENVDRAYQKNDPIQARKAALDAIIFLKRKEDLYKGNVEIEFEKFQAGVNKMFAAHFIAAIDAIDRGFSWEKPYRMGLRMMFPLAFKP